ncbi:MAG: hypothetical protein ACTHM2_15940 [Afipia sp.]|jgi:hypothetical protein
MTQIEPNALALCWFALFWSICCLSFLQLAGMYPLGSRTDDSQPAPPTFVLGSTALWLALLVGTCLFGAAELRWTSVVIVGGILFLFLPELFQAIPARWRNGWAGLTATGVTLAVALALLVSVGQSPIKALLS